MSNFEKYLHTHFNISSEDCKTLGKSFRAETIRKGEYFARAGGFCDRLSFIEEGILRIYCRIADREVTQWISTRESFVTDFASFFYRQPSTRDIQALEDSELLTIDFKEYQSLGERLPVWNQFEKVFVGKCFVFMENRILDLISLSAEQRYSRLFEQNHELLNQVPLQYIASMLGMTPETFSRIRKKRSS